jgi:hypothetical protein
MISTHPYPPLYIIYIYIYIPAARFARDAVVLRMISTPASCSLSLSSVVDRNFFVGFTRGAVGSDAVATSDRSDRSTEAKQRMHKTQKKQEQEEEEEEDEEE